LVTITQLLGSFRRSRDRDALNAHNCYITVVASAPLRKQLQLIFEIRVVNAGR